jgi:hypothetical protein
VGIGGISVGSSKYGGVFPYAQLADEDGNALAIARDYRVSYMDSTEQLGFGDWRYRPLDENRLADNQTRLAGMVWNAGGVYRIMNGLTAEVQAQWQQQTLKTENLRHAESYYVRNLVNRFSVLSSTGSFNYPFPKGGILELFESSLTAYHLRGQLNYDRRWVKHQVTALAGGEQRELVNKGYGRTSYGYDEETGTAVNNLNYSTTLPVHPAGSGSISAPPAGITETTNRFVSYYANASYTYDNRYTFYGAARKEGANLFGVRTNDRITPLWAVGVNWNAAHEAWYTMKWLPVLRLKASYGFNGNVYNASAYLTALYATSSLTGLRYATVTSPPNPSLQWEKVKNINAGIDFGLARNIVSGTIEVYKKNGLHLIQATPLAPSTGFSTYKGNAASTMTRGIDLSINGRVKLNKLLWSPTALLSYMKDEVVHYDPELAPKVLAGNTLTGTAEAAGLLAVKRKPLFGMYSYRWGGLDGATGDPMGYVDGAVSKDYLAIFDETSAEELIFHGSARPTWFGALRNDFSYRNFSLSFNITFRAGYFFRRRSTAISYPNVLTNGMHMDFDARWQKPGDEVTTQVPSIVYPANNNRNEFYRMSSVLVEDASHARLQDVRVSYDVAPQLLQKLAIKSLRLYTYFSNVGILWRANKAGIDPDATGQFAFPTPRAAAAGVQVTF